MSNELSAAGDQLASALDRYTQVCSSTRDACLNAGQINNSPELLTSLENQSSAITFYIQKLETARVSIQTARGSIPKIAPVSTLPADIWGRIFRLVLPGQTCLVQRGYDGSISHIQYPIYPDALAHVCSFWRRVAIASPSLWTHIDIALDHSLNPGLFARAKVYAIRAGQLPLEIHISDPGSKREQEREFAIQEGKLKLGEPGYGASHVWDDLHDFRILASDSVNIKTLEIDLRVYERYRETYYTMLEYFFARCKPGVLTKYVTRSNNSYLVPSPFIEPAETPHSSDGALLAVPILQLNEVWLGVSAVRISGLCPYWTATMYHGLVELYIDTGIPEISGSDLFNILRSSPKLQVFRLKKQLNHDDNENINTNPIHMPDLRQLSLMIRDDDFSTSKILQWITPGTKPLCLSLADTPREAVAEFCSRANVTRFYVWCPGDLIPILNQCRQLETLVLNERDASSDDLSSIIYNDGDNNDAGRKSGLIARPVTRIDTLYLLWHWEIPFESVKAAVEKYSIQRLLIYQGRLSYQAGADRIVSNNTRNIRAKLSTITVCPNIEYHSEGYPEHYTEDESSDPDGWFREALSSSAAVVVYDITNRTSFESAIEWIHQVWSENGSGMIVALVENKADLSHNRKVAIEEATQQANKLHVVFMEASAKNGHNIQDLFKETATILSGMAILSMEDNQLRAALDHEGRFNSSPGITAGLKRASNEITSHFQRLEGARAAIHTARSSIPKSVPIIAIPPEIMGRVFQFAVPGQLCLVQRTIKGKISQVKYPLSPDNLTHVCSFWRRVAISTPSLWTRIDIVLDHSLNPGLFARAKVYAVRAGRLPLEIRISDPGSERERNREWASDPSYGPNHEWEDLHEFKFLPSHIKTLEFDLHIHARYREIYYSILDYFFARSEVGVLTQYLVRASRNEWTGPNSFIEPVDTPHSLRGALLAVPSAHLEELLLHTSIVRVSGLCPYWKNKAYCGLVELFIDRGIPAILESQLVNILRSSPKLQVLHIKASLDKFIGGGNIQPVYLEDLTDINVTIQFDW
ncbi:hypothetical protein RSOLAG22IIIB_10917 [Rhizoctonia solani]|uniref:Uncharacterized protein n=1 Tax=Rhizoctonia solani TaxID=456999 RepID=A0A0K6G6S2_9AGAM|nr:hypothetical protein RSOLAG22IIIB_10917 [Rhizoctonia solani]